MSEPCTVICVWFIIALAPGTTMIEFSPLAATPMRARPVGASTVSSPRVSMPSPSKMSRRPRPASSPPTQPTKATLAPARAAATAWFSPLPPGASK